MSDYISRQAAIEALAGWKISSIVLEPVPSADVVEVVMCKDCKHGRDTVRGNYKHKLNLIDCNRIDYEHPYIMRSNDFCSWGERSDK